MVNDHFLGKEIGTLNADKFTIQNIEPKMIQEDLELMDKKYWDYKLWHPMVATMYFVHRYHTIAAKIIEREVGEDEARGYRVMASRYDLRKKPLATMRAFWKARQHADAIGCTYDVYIRAAIRNFRANIRLQASFKANRKQVMPYPGQLANTFVVTEAIKDWTKEKQVRFPMPEHADIPFNTELWFRPEMEAWLIEESKRSTNPTYHVDKAIRLGIIMPDPQHIP